MEMDRRKNDHLRLDWTYQRLKAIVKKDQYVNQTELSLKDYMQSPKD